MSFLVQRLQANSRLFLQLRNRYELVHLSCWFFTPLSRYAEILNCRLPINAEEGTRILRVPDAGSTYHLLDRSLPYMADSNEFTSGASAFG